MVIKRFEDIIAWQRSKELCTFIYTLFADCRDFSFKDQILRSSVSIMNNIAEGYERSGNKEFRKFLYIAKGSAAELRSMLLLADELQYINKAEFKEAYDRAVIVSKMLSGFIKTL